MASPSTWTESYPDTYTVPAGRVARGRLRVPGSKSVTQRYLALALTGRVPTVLDRPLLSEDPLLFLDAMTACGFAVSRPCADRVEVVPATTPGGGVVQCGNGGTMFRFLTAVLTTVPGTWQLDGVARLRERPVVPLVDALRQLGAEIRCPRREGYAPLEIVGGSLDGGRASLDAGASSQFLSAILIAGLAARRPVTLDLTALTSVPYVALTCDAITAVGGRVERSGDDRRFEVWPGPIDIGRVAVEGDYSAAAYPAAAAVLTGGRVTLEGLAHDSLQGDRRLLALLSEMGARVDLGGARGVVVEAGEGLRALDVDLGDAPDQVPTVAALAPFARGTTHIRNVGHLRIKECDRLDAMARELQRVGVPVQEHDDALTIPGVWADTPPPVDPVSVETYGDHRIAMAMALVGLRRPSITVDTPAVVAKSYPGFWRDLETLLQA